MNDSTNEQSPRFRWWGGTAGLVLGAIDIGCALLLDMDMQIGGRDVTAWIAVYLAGSFGALGFALGWAWEARHDERLARQRLAAQGAELAAAQTRVARNEKLATLGQLSAAIAHEVRNPLAIIRSSVQNLAEELEPSQTDAQESCRFVQEEIDRLSRVSSTLLDLARPLSLSTQPVRVGDLLRHTALLAREVVATASIRLRTEVDAEALLQVDRDLVCQVLLGLVGNAADAAPAGSEIVLSGRRNERGVELSVSDAGPGVPADLREQIFEPFFTTRERGHGLGLAVARQIVRAHAGELEVADGPAGGATFTVHLEAA